MDKGRDSSHGKGDSPGHHFNPHKMMIRETQRDTQGSPSDLPESKDVSPEADQGELPKNIEAELKNTIFAVSS